MAKKHPEKENSSKCNSNDMTDKSPLCLNDEIVLHSNGDSIGVGSNASYELYQIKDICAYHYSKE